MGKAWKEAEKEVAKFFNGYRRIRVSYSESVGDIIHPRLSIEVKYGKCIPKYLRVKYPTAMMVKKDHKMYYLVPSDYLELQKDRLFSAEPSLTTMRDECKFLDGAMRQAGEYNPTLVPVVCVKAKGMSGFVAIWGEGDNLWSY